MNSIYERVCKTCGETTLVDKPAEDAPLIAEEYAKVVLDVGVEKYIREVTAERDALLAVLQALVFAYVDADGKLRMSGFGDLPVYWQRAVELTTPSK